MATRITNKGLMDKCKRFILADPISEHLDYVIQDALVTASKEITALGGPLPLAWHRETYDELFTRYQANISAVTNANPGVITADSIDPDLSSDHGFQTNDIVFLTGIGGEDDSTHKLNERLYRAVRLTATTLTLKTLNGQADIDTTNYDTYDSGGTIYHAGFVLPASTIQPSDSWVINRLFNVSFDGKPADPCTEEQAVASGWLEPGGMPRKWRYQKYSYSTFVQSNIEHLLFWYNFPNQRFNVRLGIEKTYPDLTEFDDDHYPPHPIEIHDYIWHRALSNLATQAEKQRRVTANKDGSVTGDNTKMEIVNANYWIVKAAKDEIDILAYNRSLLGYIPYATDSMSA